MQGPRLYRFFNYEQPTYLPAPMDGWNPDANPWELPLSQAQQLDNFLIRPGKLVMRGGFSVFHDFTAITPISMAGAVLTNMDIIIGRRTVNASAMVDPWNAPLVNAAAGSLATPQLTPLTCQGFAYSSLTADQIPGPRSTIFNGQIYAISYGSAAAAASGPGSTYSIKPLSLISVPMNVTSPVLTVAANTPKGAFDIKAYQSRLWLLGGIDTPAGLTAHEPVSLFFTVPLTGLTGAFTDWRDPVSGATNKIVMDGDNTDFGVGLAKVRNGLLILRRSSIWLLKGTTTANYTLVPISREAGCIDARSIVESDNGVYFLSKKGLMLTNGTTIVNVSGSIEHLLQFAIKTEQGYVLGDQGGYASCAITSQGQIVVSIGAVTANTPGNMSPLLTAMYDPNATKGGAWVRITSFLWLNEGTQTNGSAGQQTGNLYAGIMVGNLSLSQLYSIGDSYVTTWEYGIVGQSFLDPYDIGLYDRFPSGGTPWVSIPAIWNTGAVAVINSAKRQIGIGHRYYMDYNFAANSLVPTTGWTLQPVDALTSALDTAQNVPAGLAPTATGFVSGTSPVPDRYIRRFNRDWNVEITNDVSLIASWNDANRTAQTTLCIAEIYGAGIEFQRSREARTSGQS